MNYNRLLELNRQLVEIHALMIAEFDDVNTEINYMDSSGNWLVRIEDGFCVMSGGETFPISQLEGYELMFIASQINAQRTDY